MKIGILGAGNVGGTLGQAWAKKGHQVVFGVRDVSDPELQQRLVAVGENARAASLPDTIAASDIIVLTLPWDVVIATLPSLGNLAGKVLLDCTNPNFSADPTQHHPISGGEQVAALVPGAKVIKIFNTTGFENMAEPHYGSQAITMFYAGNDEVAKAIAAQLATEIGFDAIDAGPLENSGLLESLARLWGKLAYGQKLGRNIAFKLIRR